MKCIVAVALGFGIDLVFGTTHCSEDLTKVHSGRAVPIIACGFHESQFRGGQYGGLIYEADAKVRERLHQKGRPNTNTILQLMRDDDFGDPWGTGMGWLGGVCDTIYDADPNLVPARCGYSPGMGGPEVPNGSAEPHRITLADVPYPTSEVWCWAHNIDPDNVPDTEDLPYWSDPTFAHRITELVEAAVLLDRYLNWCKLAGRDY